MRVLQVQGEEEKKWSFRRTAMHKWIVATRKADVKKARQVVEVQRQKKECAYESQKDISEQKAEIQSTSRLVTTHKRRTETQFET
jgi:adenine C2-methylase RlmN of 23S rRNA A2503 and tRNA A37